MSSKRGKPTNMNTINNCLESMREYDLIISDTQLDLASNFVKVLNVFEKLTDLMQADSYPSLSLAVFCYIEIKDSLKKLLADENCTSLVEKSASFLLKRLDHRFKITENMIVATFLDPSMQQLHFLSQYLEDKNVNMISLLIKKWKLYSPALKGKTNQTSSNQKSSFKVSSSKPSSSSQLSLELIQKHVGNNVIADDSIEGNIRKEYLKYVSITEIVAEPLKWWKTHSVTFPYLSALAAIILSIPASASVTERHWSETGGLITKKKGQIDPLTAEKIMFIHDNFKHINSNI